LQTMPRLPNRTFVDSAADDSFEPDLPKLCDAANDFYHGRNKKLKQLDCFWTGFLETKTGAWCILNNRAFVAQLEHPLCDSSGMAVADVINAY
jgi:hypothetical protein